MVDSRIHHFCLERFVNNSPAYDLTIVFVAWIPPVADQECEAPALRRLGGASEDTCLGLRQEPNVCVPDSLADCLRTHAGLQRAGRVSVAQIVESDARESRGRARAAEANYRCGSYCMATCFATGVCEHYPWCARWLRYRVDGLLCWFAVSELAAARGLLRGARISWSASRAGWLSVAAGASRAPRTVR